MIKLIVGLGNPGREYEKTRHNAGFLFLDYLAGNASWSKESKFHGLLANSIIGDNKVLLLKPQTFMNKSGLSVGAVARYYKIGIDEMLVVHDELDLSAGIVRLKKGGGHAGHNGLRDIILNLAGRDFYRLRFGVGRPSPGKNVADFVLSNPSKIEAEGIITAFDKVYSLMPKLVAGDVGTVMNDLNQK
ncbi:MAG: aminoacyl-tRNA hydrolase [Methylococcales bacterium]